MKNTIRPILILIAIILGFVIYKHFDFRTVTLKDPWLDTLYIITFVALVVLIIKDSTKSRD